MATVNLGRIKPQWQGTYASETSYVVDDMVLYNNSAYICTAASQGNAPTDTSYWDLMTQGSDIPTQSGNSGKVLKTDGSSLSWGDGLPTGGTNGQYITTDGTTASWGTVSTDVVQVASYSTTSTVGSVQLTNCFSSDYNNYRIQFVAKGATSNGPWQVIRLMSGSTELSSNLYTNMSVGANNTGVFQSVNTGTSYAYISNTCRTGHPSIMTMDISHVGGDASRWPIATFTCGGWDGTGQLKNHSGIFYYDGNVGDVDGIMFFNSAGNIEGCEITIHGFK